jgi:putative tryptophan/tyrosine transport system permease protein
MTALLGALTIGFILSFLSLGVFISFRLFKFPDLTIEGSFALGGAVTAALLVLDLDPATATLCAFIAGMAAGTITGFLKGTLKVNELLAGILVMTSLYSINLRIMGKSNIPLLAKLTLFHYPEALADRISGAASQVAFLWWKVPVQSLFILIFTALFTLICTVILYLFFRTRLGTALRAVGDNPQMARSLGINTETMTILALALSNGCVALSGALLAQYQGFADIQMGVGMLVWGIASLIIGDSIVTCRSTGLTLAGTLMGSLLFRLLVSIALIWGMNPNDLKLISAILVLIIIIFPHYSMWWKKRREQGHA